MSYGDSTEVFQHQGLPRRLRWSVDTPGKEVSLTGSMSRLSGEIGLLDSEVRVFFPPLVTPALQPEVMLPSLPPLGSWMVASCYE